MTTSVEVLVTVLEYVVTVTVQQLPDAATSRFAAAFEAHIVLEN